MGIKTIPTNIGGVQLPFNQLSGPLASLFSTDQIQNLMYPLELGNDPTLNHAVQFQIFDRSTGMMESFQNIGAQGQKLKDDITSGNLGNIKSDAADILADASNFVLSSSYKTKTKGPSLANISLYMPDTLAVNYSSNYSTIALTKTFGVAGIAANSIVDRNNPATEKNVIGYVGANAAEFAASKAGGLLGSNAWFGGENLAGVLQQSAGITVNPQLQLLYEGIDLRTFTLEFIFTPRSSKEAENIKKIIDTFVYYSSPGISGYGGGTGQFLTPPQIFKIKFAFTGNQGLVGAVSSVFKSAFSNIGLGFLNTTNATEDISNAQNAKIFDINECVLKDINVDYAPNGWAAYNDGYPIQTRMVLTFQEMQIVTKETVKKNMQGNASVGRDEMTANREAIAQGSVQSAHGYGDTVEYDR